MQRPVAPFVLSLIAGLWMLSGGAMMYGMGSYDHHSGSWMHDSWMGNHPMMGRMALSMGMPGFGLVSGVLVLAGAVLLYAQPKQHKTWGLLIIVMSGIYIFLGMGGFLAGTLGVIGGALAMPSQAGE